jgi:hypothetical protein
MLISRKKILKAILIAKSRTYLSDTNSNLNLHELRFKTKITFIFEKIRFLDQNRCTPLSLPVKIKLRLICKNIKIEDFELKPSDE